MKKFGLIGFFLLLFVQNFAQESRDIDYIRMYARLAVEEMELYKIPASITLSQGILETGGGQSRLADIANNHFGIKCKKEWTGPVISHTDDAPNECFRKYGSVQESYRDHSKFLAERPYYKGLFTLNMYDYKAWAYGLKQAGYATNPKYASTLISRIEKYKLDEFDRLTPDEVGEKLQELYGSSDLPLLSGITDGEETTAAITSDPLSDAIGNEGKTIEFEKHPENPMLRIKKHPNGNDYIIVHENETLLQISKLYDVDLEKLASYNELPKNGKLTPGQLLFFKKKENKGVENYYKVQVSDNMYLISQKMGMKISKLYKLNGMRAGQQPKPGTVLNLKTRKR